MAAISEEFIKFIQTVIRSPDRMRILLLLREGPDQDWDTETVSRRLYLPLERVETELADLQGGGFLVCMRQGSATLHRYRPLTSENREMVDRMAKMDREQPVTLINLVYSKPRAKIQEFADAFKIK